MCKARSPPTSPRAPAAIARCRPRGSAGTRLASETRGDEDFAGLRAYEPGVPLKHMAWKVLARGGEAAVRSYTSSGGAARMAGMVVAARAQDTETRLSQLCLWVLESEAAQRVYGLRIPGKEIAPSRGAAHRFACLRALAAYRRSRSRDDHRAASTYEQLAGDFALPRPGAARAHRHRCRVWVLAIVAVSGGIRLVLARRGRAAPPRGVRLVIAVLAIALLFLQFRTFNGLSAGTALLALMAGLKLLETETRRDIYIITLIIYFVSLAALLEGDSFWLLAYLIGVCWLTTATLLRLTSTRPAPGLAPQPALCRANSGSSLAAGAGVLAVLSAVRADRCGTCRTSAAAPHRVERHHESRRHHQSGAVR